jgi:hypothetical protein
MLTSSRHPVVSMSLPAAVGSARSLSRLGTSGCLQVASLSSVLHHARPISKRMLMQHAHQKTKQLPIIEPG